MVLNGSFMGYLIGKSSIKPSLAVFNYQRGLNLILNRLIPLVSEFKKELSQLASFSHSKFTEQHHLETISSSFSHVFSGILHHFPIMVHHVPSFSHHIPLVSHDFPIPNQLQAAPTTPVAPPGGCPLPRSRGSAARPPQLVAVASRRANGGECGAQAGWRASTLDAGGWGGLGWFRATQMLQGRLIYIYPKLVLFRWYIYIYKCI